MAGIHRLGLGTVLILIIADQISNESRYCINGCLCTCIGKVRIYSTFKIPDKCLKYVYFC